MIKFSELNIKGKIVDGLEKEGITIPTDIQIETINQLIENKDLVASAITGSGKTLAYLIPSFERIMPESKDLHTIVLAPTHELVVQINNVIRVLAKNSEHEIRSTTIIGNVNIKRQIESLKLKPHIIVGTPGRVLELIKLRRIKAHQVKTIVLDEADKLLSDNNIDMIKSIIKTTLKERQLVAVSASISNLCRDKAVELMKEPLLINLTGKNVNKNIEHFYIVSQKRKKIDVLRSIIHGLEPEKAIVFINKNELIQDVMERLIYHKISVVGMFGNATKDFRKKALDDFKSGKSNILISSDLVARGLDFQNVTHIINLDLPEDTNEYIHRAGRTGRVDAKGVVVSIVSEKEITNLKKIEKINGIQIKLKSMFMGDMVDEK
jgi:superfamily II DNA/RNA helicase